MAFEAGAVVARFKADISNFEKNIKKAEGGLKDFDRKTNKIAGAIGKSLLTIGAAAGAATVGAGIFAVKSAANIESLRVSFNTIIGDAKLAGKTLAELSDFAAKTPFQLPQVVDAGKTLLAFGFSAGEVKEQLRAVGDIASGINAPIGEIAEIYGKAKVQGRLFMEDINQLTGRGIPIIQELAKQFGVTEGEVRKLVENGEIGFEHLEKGFGNMTSEGGQFFDMMEQQSKTFGGQMSNIQDSIGRVARNIVGLSDEGDIREGSIFYHVKKGAESLAKWISDNEDEIVAFFDTIIEYVSDFAKQVEIEFNKAKSWLDKNKVAVEVLAVTLGSLSIAFLVVTAAIKGYYMVIGIATALTKIFGVVVAVVTSPITLVVLAIASLIAIGYLLIRNWDEIKETAKTVGNWVKDKFEQAVNFVNNLLSQFNPAHWMNQAKDKLFGVSQGIQDAVSDGFWHAVNFVNDLLRNFNPAHWLSQKLDGIKNWASDVKSTITGAFSGSGSGGERRTGIMSWLPKFADGGIVGGSSFTGDRVLAAVNSGEMILNRQQQSQLFDMINTGGTGGGISIANVNIADRQTADYFFQALDDRQRLAKLGVR